MRCQFHYLLESSRSRISTTAWILTASHDSRSLSVSIGRASSFAQHSLNGTSPQHIDVAGEKRKKAKEKKFFTKGKQVTGSINRRDAEWKIFILCTYSWKLSHPEGGTVSLSPSDRPTRLRHSKSTWPKKSDLYLVRKSHWEFRSWVDRLLCLLIRWRYETRGSSRWGGFRSCDSSVVRWDTYQYRAVCSGKVRSFGFSRIASGLNR